MWAVAAVAAVATVIAGGESVWLFLAAASFGAVYYGGGWRAPSSVVGILPLATVNGFAGMGTASLGSTAWYFMKAGALTFGSGLTIVPFLHPRLVDEHHWLAESQFTGAVALDQPAPSSVR